MGKSRFWFSWFRMEISPVIFSETFSFFHIFSVCPPFVFLIFFLFIQFLNSEWRDLHSDLIFSVRKRQTCVSVDFFHFPRHRTLFILNKDIILNREISIQNVDSAWRYIHFTFSLFLMFCSLQSKETRVSCFIQNGEISVLKVDFSIHVVSKGFALFFLTTYNTW